MDFYPSRIEHSLSQDPILLGKSAIERSLAFPIARVELLIGDLLDLIGEEILRGRPRGQIMEKGVFFAVPLRSGGEAIFRDEMLHCGPNITEPQEKCPYRLLSESAPAA